MILIEWDYVGYGDYEKQEKYPYTGIDDALKIFLDKHRDVREFAVWEVSEEVHDGS